jgi:hypothetical protein
MPKNYCLSCNETGLAMVKKISSKTVKKKPSRKVKTVKTSRAGEAMKILKAGSKDLLAEEMLRSRKAVPRKKTSNAKRVARG